MLQVNTVRWNEVYDSVHLPIQRASSCQSCPNTVPARACTLSSHTCEFRRQVCQLGGESCLASRAPAFRCSIALASLYECGTQKTRLSPFSALHSFFFLLMVPCCRGFWLKDLEWDNPRLTASVLANARESESAPEREMPPHCKKLSKYSGACAWEWECARNLPWVRRV